MRYHNTIGCWYFCYLCSPQIALVFGKLPCTVAGCLEYYHLRSRLNVSLLLLPRSPAYICVGRSMASFIAGLLIEVATTLIGVAECCRQLWPPQLWLNSYHMHLSTNAASIIVSGSLSSVIGRRVDGISGGSSSSSSFTRWLLRVRGKEIHPCSSLDCHILLFLLLFKLLFGS